MKLALITDIHANREAFEACLDQARWHGAERLVLLGDFVGYGADPVWVVDRVRELVAQGAIAVKGNHDVSVTDAPSPHLVEDARRVVAWTRQQLDAAQLDFLRTLPLQRAEGGCLFVHANAHAPARWDYLTTREDAARTFEATTCRHVFCGHVHAPALYHRSSLGKVMDFQPTPGVAIPVPSHRQWLVLPGSAGQPRDGNPAACWAMYDTVHEAVTFFRVPYDVEAAAAKIRAAGLPAFLAERLLIGN